jgi:CheY-like chemotaxis protein
MRSSVVKRSIVINGHKTSISLEDGFWTGLNEIAVAKGTTRREIVNMLAADPARGNLSSAIRLYVLNYFRLTADKSGKPTKRVLVVDDEPLVLRMAAEMVEDIGCEVRTARDGAEALTNIAGDQRIEILITDINMSGMSGYELAEHAKRIRADLQVILLSGRESTTHGLPLIRKPFLESDLKRVMSQVTGLC